ncbi:ATP-binding cassette domain-containing protein [Pasteuria penetrans]|uniref:ATP-binding cassette domain-containing protein n=1 Tax=Pasteuria penetrans TaxID=86005 RepID=UPI00165BAC9C|nr:ATP-binding cassette domain-containing protein [Pasteuria penetrans]
MLQLSAKAPEGITAILGNPGAGKSILIRMTALEQVPDDGHIAYTGIYDEPFLWKLGNAHRKISQATGLRHHLHYLPIRGRIATMQTVENILLQAAQSKKWPQPRLLCRREIMQGGLARYRHRPACTLMGSTWKKFMIIRSRLLQPVFWLLDEPTYGLDPLGKQLLERALQERPKNSVTVLSTTYDLKLAERADHLILLDNGICKQHGKKNLLIASIPEKTVTAWYKNMHTTCFNSHRPSLPGQIHPPPHP